MNQRTPHFVVQNRLVTFLGVLFGVVFGSFLAHSKALLWTKIKPKRYYISVRPYQVGPSEALRRDTQNNEHNKAKQQQKKYVITGKLLNRSKALNSMILFIKCD